MRKVDDGEEKKEKRKKRKKNGVFSGHYVIASSLPPKRLRPNDDRWNAAPSCQKLQFLYFGVEIVNMYSGIFGHVTFISAIFGYQTITFAVFKLRKECQL